VLETGDRWGIWDVADTWKDHRGCNGMRKVWVVSGAVCPHGEGCSILQGVCHDLLKTRLSPLFMLGGNLISGTSLMI